MPSRYTIPDTPLCRYIHTCILSTPVRCTHTPNTVSTQICPPNSLTHPIQLYTHSHTCPSTYIPRYKTKALTTHHLDTLCTPPPKYTCAFTHPPLRYTRIQTHSTQTIPTHCLTQTPDVPLHSLSHTIQIYPHLTCTTSRYTHSHSPTQVNRNTYNPSRYTYTFLPLDTSMLSHPHYIQKHLHSLLHIHTIQIPLSLNHHHPEYPHSTHTMQIHPYSLSHTIHRYLIHIHAHTPKIDTSQLYIYSHTALSSPRCAQILSLSHTHIHTT